MSLAHVTLSLIVLIVLTVATVVLVVVPLVVRNLTYVRLSLLRDELHELEVNRPGTLRHADVVRLDTMIADHLIGRRLPSHVVFGIGSAVLRARSQGRIPKRPRPFQGLELQHQRDLKRIERLAVFYAVRSYFLDTPLWFLTVWPWLAARMQFRRTGAHRSVPKAQRRAEAFVVYLGDGTDFDFPIKDRSSDRGNGVLLA